MVLVLIPLLALSACQIYRSADSSKAWVTVQADSLNDGDEGDEHCRHDWAYAPESFKSEAQLPPSNPGESWTERERERICRVCLRHEWQAQKIVSPQPVMSEFDSLRARLR